MTLARANVNQRTEKEAVKEEERHVSFFFPPLLRLLLVDSHSRASVLRLRVRGLLHKCK